MKNETLNQSTPKDLVLTRIINAPRERVFNAWVDREELAKWWGPNGFTNPVCKIDVRPGGLIYIDMKAPDGTLYPMDGEFKEIVSPERLVFIAAPLDADGKRLFEVLNTVSFEEANGKTKLTVRATVSNFRSEGKHHLDGMEEGWMQSINRLESIVSDKIPKP